MNPTSAVFLKMLLALAPSYITPSHQDYAQPNNTETRPIYKSCPEFPLARNFSLCKFPTLFRSRFCKNVTDQKNTGNFVIFCRVHQNNVLTSSSQLVQ